MRWKSENFYHKLSRFKHIFEVIIRSVDNQKMANITCHSRFFGRLLRVKKGVKVIIPNKMLSHPFMIVLSLTTNRMKTARWKKKHITKVRFLILCFLSWFCWELIISKSIKLILHNKNFIKTHEWFFTVLFMFSIISKSNCWQLGIVFYNEFRLQ